MSIVEEKFGEYSEWIDLEARNCFTGGVGVGTIKSAAGFNHYSVRNKLINAGLVGNRCPRCNEIEDWSHVVQCSSIDHLKEAYLIDMKQALRKIKCSPREEELIEMIIQDARQYLFQEQQEFVTTQQVIK